jgi:ribosome assembly protein 4
VIQITYQPQAIFRVREITRCTSSLEGHSDAILNVSFSPLGDKLASGGGDTTVRLWDLETQLPIHTLKGHANWVLYVSWSPDGNKLASGGMDKEIKIWDVESAKQVGPTLKGHTNYVTSICWEPLHLNKACNRMVSASKDGTAKIWDVILGRCLFSLTSHTMNITCVKWSGQNIIYTASQDRTIKMWSPDEGKMLKTLQGHAHWVNTLALNTDYLLRTGAHDPEDYIAKKKTQDSTSTSDGKTETDPRDLLQLKAKTR